MIKDTAGKCEIDGNGDLAGNDDAAGYQADDLPEGYAARAAASPRS